MGATAACATPGLDCGSSPQRQDRACHAGLDPASSSSGRSHPTRWPVAPAVKEPQGQVSRRSEADYRPAREGLTVGAPAARKIARMTKTVGDQILERLHAWGVRRVFGYPGDGINGLMGAFGRLGD